jgi:phosphoadenosine phosphosulfate reductase
VRGLAEQSPAHDGRIVPDLEHLGAREVLGYVAGRFGAPELGVAVSFQKESSIVVHLLSQIAPGAHFFTLDTGVLFPETYETWRKFEEHFGIEIKAYRGITLAKQAVDHGPELWARDPDACCALRKVQPLDEALGNVDAWVSGVRREQSNTRASTKKLDWDAKHGIWKANPLADWTEKDVWTYIMDNGLPYHPLHDRGYGSIGCTHCTMPGEGREGRWAGLGKVECGIHGR